MLARRENLECPEIFMPLPPLNMSKATRLPVRLTGGLVPHPGSECRVWEGHFECCEPIVALAISITGKHVDWTRTSHRGTQSVETSILFSPFDDDSNRVRVCFSILDSGVVSHSTAESVQPLPAPLLQSFQTGELVSVASISSEPTCELKALFLARRDVVSVRNGVWHAHGNTVVNLEEPWRTILTYGRTGEFEIT